VIAMTNPIKQHQDRVRDWQTYAAEHYLHVLGQSGPLDTILIKPLPFRTWLRQQQQEGAA
jgi:hypothetical protein